MNDGLTYDAFLGGKLHLWQPEKGYRAGVDPVLLAAAVPAKEGESVLDLGCGVGAAALCLGARVPGLRLTGIEVQHDYAELARRNGGGDFEVFTGDLAEMPPQLKQHQFDHVIANPPYFESAARRAARDVGREAALGQAVALGVWIRTAGKRLAPKGVMSFINRIERLPDMLCALEHDMGSVEVLPLAARQGRRPELAIVRARKSGRGDFVLHSALVMHEGVTHNRDGDSYIPLIRTVLREGAALEFGVH